MRIVFAAGAMLAMTAVAQADCAFATTRCSTDSYGNTYRTEQNLGGGWSTTRNGSRYSTTEQTLGGGYREEFRGGGSRDYNYKPYP